MNTENRTGNGRIAAALSRALSRIAPRISPLHTGVQPASDRLLSPVHMAPGRDEDETGRQYVLPPERPDVSLNELYGQFVDISSRDSDHSTHDPVDEGVVSSRQSIARPFTIATFPTELLVNIFALMSRNHPPVYPDLDNANRIRRLGWLVVTHVCRHWRHIAVGTPALWKYVDFSMGPVWVPLILARAHELPVMIRKDFSYDHWGNKRRFPSELEVLKAHLFHTRRLSFAGDPGQLTGALQSLDVPAPLLDHLHLYFLQTSLVPPWEFSPRPFFASQHPRLRSLSLSNFGFRWPINLPISGLVNLYIRFFVMGRYHLSHDLGGLLDLVESIPTLQFLHISELQVSGNGNAGLWHGHGVVKIPHLNRLQIDCGKYPFFGLINHIDIPPGASLDLSVKVDPLGPTRSVGIDTQAILTIVSKHMHTVTPIQTLFFKYEGGSGSRNTYWVVEVLAWGVCVEGDDGSAAPDETPVLRLAGDSLSVSPVVELPSQVCEALPLTFLRMLSVTSACWTSAQWTALFSRCSALEHVYAAKAAAVAFVRAVSPPGAEGLVPSLETVAITGLDVKARDYTDDKGTSRGDVLVAWLMRRKEKQMELRRLRLISCVVSPDQIAAISGFVGTIEVSKSRDLGH
ncbi:hypothetical protein BV25DRAFT_168453 [Artomyces pyxidatus]|uniref:Uncharacterized protein n=1 Tax=Artomyces pyxidatus TaxID=48021 RepID=A0ACB8SG54_9AGAM|nr:hypothetical protein BV25DRAFT_168453 [Artomyces pyxidatus]